MGLNFRPQCQDCGPMALFFGARNRQAKRADFAGIFVNYVLFIYVNIYAYIHAKPLDICVYVYYIMYIICMYIYICIVMSISVPYIHYKYMYTYLSASKVDFCQRIVTIPWSHVACLALMTWSSQYSTYPLVI